MDWNDINKMLKDIDKKYRNIKDKILIILPSSILAKEWEVDHGTYLYPNYDFYIGNMGLEIKGYDEKYNEYQYVVDDDGTIYRPEAIRVVEIKEELEIMNN